MNQRKHGLLASHRPDPELNETHCSLMNAELCKIFADAGEVAIDDNDCQFTISFCASMCQYFNDENARLDTAKELLNDYLGVTIPCLESLKIGAATTDGCIVARLQNASVPVCIMECKNELGTGGGDSIQQLMGYYAKWIALHVDRLPHSVLPCLLVSLVGPRMSVWAAVKGRRLSFDVVTPLLDLLVIKQDRDKMSAVARMLKTLKLGVHSLVQHYENLSTSFPLTEAMREQLMYPFVNTFVDSNGQEIRFQYQGQLVKGLNLFVARSLTAPSVHFVVKFTRDYCQEAHRKCFETHQGAPELYAVTELPGRWKMVVMELVNGSRFELSHATEGHRRRLKDIVAALHADGWVHGDLRFPNILCCENGRVCVLDFDWSGKAGIKTYPSFMNHASIQWPEGVGANQTLQTAHDNAMLNRLLQE